MSRENKYTDNNTAETIKCRRCKKMVVPQVLAMPAGIIIRSVCPFCGVTINRYPGYYIVGALGLAGISVGAFAVYKKLLERRRRVIEQYDEWDYGELPCPHIPHSRPDEDNGEE